ncbi:hypothetical protein FA15DRAFT_699550 [Coprinopsis marcescibilis]|uniref:Carbohydrate esterase family 16 protein n=1 Tax=Coprinopsis marcescibilis TaxID=230819 RepID=A0A5C3LAB4_COPMA|nr:hypothetical protein FA15DRAFT_699550 [Coprinopsis marcescibilis]
MSLVLRVSSSWSGFSNIKRVFIFGDSYSSIFHVHDGFSESEHPTPLQPLGTPFPGNTWNEEGLPNWVGHMITKYSPGPRFNPSRVEQDEAYRADPLLIYDYACGGDRVDGVKRQIQRLFLPIVGTKPNWAPWNESNSLFVTSIGINDCATLSSEDHAASIEVMMGLQEELYAAGARNFCFFDIPPIEKSPAIAERISRYGLDGDVDETMFQKWNRVLLQEIQKFSEKHPDCTVLLFSMHHVFTVILEDAQTYGFPPGHESRRGGTFWVDHVHPSSKVHDLLAHFLTDFLSVPAKVTTDEPVP